MEEVWRDYMSLQSSSSTTPASHPSPPPSPPSSYRDAGILQDFFTSAPAPQQLPQTPPPLPTTALSLSSTLEFTNLGGSSSTSGGMIFPFAPAPRMTGVSGGDRRHQRMIKNRESAARSRARKQAYTNELELALARLRRENAVLVNLHQELNVRLAMTVQVAGRPSVQRCRSAPL